MAISPRQLGALLTVIAALVMAGTGISGCDSKGRGLLQHRTAFVLVLVDVSGSTASARQSYLRDLTTVMADLRSGDVLWADRITDNSLASSHVVLKVDIPKLNWLAENKDQYDSEMSAIMQKARAEAQPLVAGKADRTTVLDSMLFAQKVFRSTEAREATDHVLVVLSDMREDSGRYDFDRERLTGLRIKQIVSREMADHRIPDLKGVQVYVSGATSNATAGAEQIRQTEAFWQAYFRAAGTDLPDRHYAASLLDFHLHDRSDE